MRTPQARTPRIATLKRWTFLVGVNVLVFAVLVLCLEGGYRLFKLYKYGMVDYVDSVTVGAYKRDELYGLRPTPNFRSDQIPDKIRFNPNSSGYEKLFTFNSLGYRGKEFSIQKPVDVFRIVALGGSTTADVESSDNDTWSAILESKLNADAPFRASISGKRVEVINAGIGSSRTREGLLRLRNEIVNFSPDVLLVGYVWNDVMRGLRGENPHAATPPDTPWWYHSAILQNLRIRYLRYQETNSAVYEKYAESLGTARTSPWGMAYEQNLLEMNAIASRVGAKLILVNLPGLCRKESRMSHEYELILKRTRVTRENFDFWVSVKGFVTAEFERMGREHGIETIDVNSYFGRFSNEHRVGLFTDEMHLTDAGARAVAEAISKADWIRYAERRPGVVK